MNWQPIETARKDGYIVLLADFRAGCANHYVGHFASKTGGRKNWITIPGAWVRNPTHWMPLPAPPAEKEKPVKTLTTFRCQLFGHDAEGPFRDGDDTEGLERPLYRCRRCLRTIRFRKAVPNGWQEVPELINLVVWPPAPADTPRPATET